METLGEFVGRLSEEVNCFYHLCSSGIFSLKKENTNIRGRMGVFGWVRERMRNKDFEISSYKQLGDRAQVSHLADGVVPGMMFVSKENDFGQATGIVFYVQKGSKGRDYQKAVKALSAILRLK